VTIDPVTRLDVAELYAAYAACLDNGPLDAWPDFFTEAAGYRLIPRENHDAGHPLATMALEGRGMMRDRVYGAQNTLFHAPYYQRHVIGPVRFLSGTADDMATEANYAVFRTKRDGIAELFNTGRYLDRIVREGGELRFAEKLCVFDSDLILNSIIYPI
jgi:salicylate 5-hydroxylase small subunit